jgi:hypothetical protein
MALSTSWYSLSWLNPHPCPSPPPSMRPWCAALGHLSAAFPDPPLEHLCPVVTKKSRVVWRHRWISSAGVQAKASVSILALHRSVAGTGWRWCSGMLVAVGGMRRQRGLDSEDDTRRCTYARPATWGSHGWPRAWRWWPPPLPEVAGQTLPENHDLI